MKARSRYNKSVTTVSEYLVQFPQDVKTRLSVIRNVVRKCAPKAVESISYSIPAYKLEGKRLVYFAGYGKFVSLYALPKTTKAFTKELSAYKTSKGTVQFQNSEPFPLPLIRKIVYARVAEVKKELAP